MEKIQCFRGVQILQGLVAATLLDTIWNLLGWENITPNDWDFLFITFKISVYLHFFPKDIYLPKYQVEIICDSLLLSKFLKHQVKCVLLRQKEVYILCLIIGKLN